MLWVAAASPFANLVMAIGWALLFRVAVGMPDSAYALPMAKMTRRRHADQRRADVPQHSCRYRLPSTVAAPR